MVFVVFFFFSSRRRHTRSLCDWSSDVCSSDLDLDAREVVAEPVERGHADGLQGPLAAPDDPLAGLLLDDLGLPRAADAPDVLVEHERRVVPLLDLLEAVHEVRPVLELRELVVRGLDVDRHVDVLLDGESPAAAVTRRLLAALALAAADL